MGMFEAWMAQLEYLEKKASLAGRPDLMPAIRMAVLAGDDGLYRDLSQLLDDILLVAQPEDVHPFLPTPGPGELPQGTIPVASVVGGGRLLLAPEHFELGTGVFGMIGTGKTTTIAQLVEAHLSEGLEAWVFDREGDFLERLAPLLLSGRMLLLKFRDLRMNLFEPVEGQSPVDAITAMVKRLRELWFLADGSQHTARQILMRLFGEAGALDGSQAYPCLLDFDQALDVMSSTSQRGRDWLVTLKNRAGSVAVSYPEVFGVSRGFPVECMLKHSILFDLRGIDGDFLKLAVVSLVHRAMAYRERHRPGRLTHLFVMDEVHRLLEGAERAGEVPYLLEVALTARKNGIALLVGGQSPSQIPTALFGSLGMKLVFRLSDGRDTLAVANALSLSPEQRMYLPGMPPRRAVVHSGLVLDRPFLVDMPEIGDGHAEA